MTTQGRPGTRSYRFRAKRPEPPHTLAGLFTAYAEEYFSDRAASTNYHYRMFFRRVLVELGPNTPITDITPDVLRAWKQRLSTHCGPGTIRKYMRMLSCVLRVAVEELQWIDVHPMTRIRKPSAPPGIVRFLSTEERVALLAACQASPSPYLYPIVLLALSTGGRKEEICGLRWPEVDLAAGVVRFLKTKTQNPRTVPLIGEALQVLTAWYAQRNPLVPWVFPHKKGDRSQDVNAAWRAARTASGIQNCRFHDLRHTFASYLALSGASLRDIAELLGHRKLTQSMLYTHLLESHTAAVVERMAHKFLSDPRPPQDGGAHDAA